MKDFFKNYSYYSVKMFIDQFVMAMLGLTVSLAFGISGNNTGKLVSSICTVLFYLFLIYYMTWEVGSQDRVSVNNGKLKSMPLKGLYMSLLANSINFIIAILFTAFVNLQALMIVMANFIEGM
jgi:hypothetical protein